jgi:SAM-dependent methyltransferase
MTSLAHFWEGVGQQLRCPTGRWGRLTGRVMAVANRQPNRIAIDALGVAATDTVLELGFGPGEGIRALSALAPRGLVLGIDQSPDMLAQASRTNRRAIDAGRVQLGLGRFDALPYASNSVDKILAVNVVYFFGKAGGEIREAMRVLRPGAVIVIYATHRSTMSRWKFAGPDTHSHIDEDGLRTLAVRGGFASSEVSIRPVALPFGIAGVIGILRKQS